MCTLTSNITVFLAEIRRRKASSLTEVSSWANSLGNAGQYSFINIRITIRMHFQNVCHSNSHRYTHLILALGIVRKPTILVFIT